MMTLDHVGDREAMVYAQLGQQPLVRTTATSLEPRRGTLSCLSARPPDLADAAITRPQVVSMFLGDRHLASRGGRHSKDVDKPRRGGLTPLAKSSPL